MRKYQIFIFGIFAINIKLWHVELGKIIDFILKK